TDAGDLDYAHFEELLRSYQPKLVACTMLSNALGTVTEVNKILSLAKNEGALVLLDAAQAVCHMPIRVKDLAADFLVFSGHKLYGPTGIGVLYVRHECFDFMQPFLGGGDMIETVSVNGSTWAEPPQKFEAGTPPIAEAIGLGAAIDFVSELSWSSIQGHERALFQYAHQALSAIPGVRLLGPGGEKQVSIISFTVEGLHPHDLATIADSCNVQIRAGHHCAMPLLSALEVPATARMSLGIYSTKDDIDRLVESVKKAQKIVA
ncbi:MAG: aminotransferase class V-fold PLP-dependent enzyme, partial [Bdellovibrionales bacterium]|nr:aminotransferase class V-fold PLP-dependent enzyme [Bdellovibrionales bacterium]